MMKEGKCVQGGEEESTVLETVIKKNPKTHIQKTNKQIPNNKRVLEHHNTSNNDR